MELGAMSISLTVSDIEASRAFYATLGFARAAAGEADDPASLVPEYLRPSYADERAALPR